MTDQVFITTEVTNQDIYKKLNEMGDVQQKILAHAKYTNGRVTVIEKKSIGLWISNHPFKFSAFCLMFFSFVISDIRHPLINFVTSLFL